MRINNLEVKRKLFHLLSGVLIVFLFYFNYINIWHIFILLILMLAFYFLVYKFRIRLFDTLLSHLERSHNRTKFPARGAVLFMLGVSFTVLFFEKNIALASILILSVGDTLSTLINIHFGSLKFFLFKDGKFVEGFIFSFLFSSISAMFFVSPLQAFVSSFFAMILESIGVRFGDFFIDDNLTLPLMSGLIMTFIHILL